MPLPVSLRDIMGELEIQANEMSLYLDRRSGEVMAVFHGDYAAENEVDPEEIEESEDYIALPNKRDIHEWDLMDRFTLTLRDARIRDELRSAIRGSGAFRAFKTLIRRHDLEESWYRFRDVAIARIAAECLDEHGIAYVVDVDGFAEEEEEVSPAPVAVEAARRMEVGALILYTRRLAETVAFYRALGMPLEEESHEGGPRHYACDLGPTHVAVYEAAGGRAQARGSAGSVMAGFTVGSVTEAIAAVRSFGAHVVEEPSEYPWGMRALVDDPDGRTVEIFERRGDDEER